MAESKREANIQTNNSHFKLLVPKCWASLGDAAIQVASSAHHHYNNKAAQKLLLLIT